MVVLGGGGIFYARGTPAQLSKSAPVNTMQTWQLYEYLGAQGTEGCRGMSGTT